jgi:lysophospholipase L1-like esterase
MPRYILLFFLLPYFVQVSAQRISPFESEIQHFDSLDNSVLYPNDAILFTGSSSIRLWKTLAEDMAPHPVIQRGFGGSKMTDVLHYADRILKNHQCNSVVVFVANDIIGASDGSDKRPEEVAGLFEDFVNIVRYKKGDIPIFLIAITPTASRWKVWPQIRKVNLLLARLADRSQNVVFIPTEDLFLGEDGLPMSDLFIADQLHLSARGYALWTKRLRAYLDPVLDTAR